MVNWNQEADLGQIYKGFLNIYDGATPFRFKHLVELIFIVQADSEKFYSDTGVKVKKNAGDSSTFEARVKDTADLYDTVDPNPTDIKTLSYFADQIMNKRNMPIADFEGVNEYESASNKFVHHRFIGFVEGIERARREGAGVHEVIISGEMKTHTELQRTAT